jgi:hypothetical protein
MDIGSVGRHREKRAFFGIVGSCKSHDCGRIAEKTCMKIFPENVQREKIKKIRAGKFLKIIFENFKNKK